jgi:hypothetical protein
MGIVTIASNSGSARTSSSESEVKQTSIFIFYRTNGVRRSVAPRKELNQMLSTYKLEIYFISLQSFTMAATLIGVAAFLFL